MIKTILIEKAKLLMFNNKFGSRAKAPKAFIEYNNTHY